MTKVRTHESGATRSSVEGKYEIARFLDSRVLKRYAQHLHEHRIQPDGTLRDPDNWKKGQPLQWYMDGLSRHWLDLLELHQHGESVRPETGQQVTLEETLCSIVFNAMGYLYEVQRKVK